MNVRRWCGLLAVVASLAISSSALALDNSTRGPFYVQGTVPGLNYYNFVSNNGYGWAGWRPDVEVGAHITGRHDGIVLGFRQAFVLTAVQGRAGAVSALRYGYDIPIPVGDFELTLAPYGALGIGYVFDGLGPGGPSAGLGMSWGIDTKFFIASGFYAFARPFEMGFQCYHDSGNCALAMAFGAGAGFAFPDPK